MEDEARRDGDLEEERLRKRLERARFVGWALKRRMEKYGDANLLPRLLKARAALEKARVKSKNVVQCYSLSTQPCFFFGPMGN